MIGAIIGDIAGSIYEFNNTFDYNINLFREGRSYTDDSICTAAIADAIRSNKKHPDFAGKLQKWCKQYPHPMGGYGGSFAMWIYNQNPTPYNSFGNGAAMRVSPVAWLYDDLDMVLKMAAKSASVSHDHPEGIRGAQCVAHSIYHLRTTNDLKGLKDIVDQYYPGFANMEYPKGVFNESCQGTVPVCCKILLDSSSFEDAIRSAVSFGGDSDTIGAIVGSMAEAIYEIPGELITDMMIITPKRILDAVMHK